MRRELKLVLIGLIFVTAPAAILTFVAARTLSDWQLVVAKQMETAAARSVQSMVAAWSAQMTESAAHLRTGVERCLARPDPTAGLVRLAAGFARTNSWCGDLAVVRAGSGAIYPARLAVSPGPGPATEPPAPDRAFPDAADELPSRDAELRRALGLADVLLAGSTNWTAVAREYQTILGRSDLSRADEQRVRLRLASCYREAGRPAEAEDQLRHVIADTADAAAGNGETPPRDPDEGFFYDLEALKLLAVLDENMARPAAALEDESELLERALSRYSAVAPLQRELIFDRVARDIPRLLAAGGVAPGEARAVKAAGLLAEMNEWARAQRPDGGMPPGLAEEIDRRLHAGSVNPFAWNGMILAGEPFLFVMLSSTTGLAAVVRVNSGALAAAIVRTGSALAAASGLRVRVQGLESGSGAEPVGGAPRDGAPLSEQRLAAPFGYVSLVATPADPVSLQASTRLRSRLYAMSAFVLAASVLVGAWMMWHEAAGEIRRARARSDFVAAVSHDLRTPLSSMRMLAESLYLGRIADGAKQRQFLGTILKECDRLGRLTDRALYFIRLGQDAMRYSLTEGDLGRLVKDTADVFATGAREGEIDLQTFIAPDLPPVRFDAGAMEQVVFNLLDNAAKYSPDRKEIRVSVRSPAPQHEVVIAVQDSGIGIDVRDRKRIFGAYYRGPGARVAATAGQGLGLALCRHVARAHGGRIEVESEPGRGSTFRVVLPAAGT